MRDSGIQGRLSIARVNNGFIVVQNDLVDGYAHPQNKGPYIFTDIFSLCKWLQRSHIGREHNKTEE